jgi:hypothetical protein
MLKNIASAALSSIRERLGCRTRSKAYSVSPSSISPNASVSFSWAAFRESPTVPSSFPHDAQMITVVGLAFVGGGIGAPHSGQCAFIMLLIDSPWVRSLSNGW